VVPFDVPNVAAEIMTPPFAYFVSTEAGDPDPAVVPDADFISAEPPDQGPVRDHIPKKHLSAVAEKVIVTSPVVPVGTLAINRPRPWSENSVFALTPAIVAETGSQDGVIEECALSTIYLLADATPRDLPVKVYVR